MNDRIRNVKIHNAENPNITFSVVPPGFANKRKMFSVVAVPNLSEYKRVVFDKNTALEGFDDLFGVYAVLSWGPIYSDYGSRIGVIASYCVNQPLEMFVIINCGKTKLHSGEPKLMFIPQFPDKEFMVQLVWLKSGKEYAYPEAAFEFWQNGKHNRIKSKGDKRHGEDITDEALEKESPKITIYYKVVKE